MDQQEIIEKLRNADHVLKNVIDSISLSQFTPTKNVFHDLLSCIIEQQIHYRSTKKIFHNLLAKSEIEQLTPENFHIFEEKALQFTKISMNKQETIVKILEHWSQNKIDYFALSDDEIRTVFSSIKGVGKWTMDMILMYSLERPNIFPYDDFHLKQIMVNLYGLNPNSKLKSQMCEIAEKWEPHSSLAVQYLLARKSENKKLNN